METKFNIDDVNAWLEEEQGMSYDELSNEFNKAVDLLSKSLKQRKEMRDKINKAIEFIEKEKTYVSSAMAKDTNLRVGSFMWNVDELLEILKEDK